MLEHTGYACIFSLDICLIQIAFSRKVTTINRYLDHINKRKKENSKHWGKLNGIN